MRMSTDHLPFRQLLLVVLQRRGESPFPFAGCQSFAILDTPDVKKREDSSPGLTHRGVHPAQPPATGEKNKMPARNEETQVVAADQGPMDAGPLNALLPGTASRVAREGHDIALANDRGTVFAFANLCLRCGHALSDGTLAGGLLACGHCGWQYELERGCVVGLPGLKIEMHRVRIEDGRMYVDVHPGPGPDRPA
jgi:nitrite reductase/ring-hydroxylating ferredoxin subunit